MPTFVIAGSASTQATSPAASRPLQCVYIVELDSCGRDRRIHRWPNVSGSRPGFAVGIQSDERFIHRAVIAPVKHQNLRPSRDLPRQPDRKPIRIRSRQRELPVRQMKSLLQFLGYKNRILPRQHQSNTQPRLIFHGFDRRGWRMSGHRTRVAQAKVDVAMPVHVDKVRPVRLLHKRRKRSRPLHHPVHGHARQQRLPRPLKQRLRLRTLLHKLLLLALHQGLQLPTVDGFHVQDRFKR